MDLTGLVGTDMPRQCLRSEVEQELQSLFSRSMAAAQVYGADFLRLWSLAESHVQGGKLVRPLLLLETYDAVLGSEDQPLASEGPHTLIARGSQGRSEVVRIAAAVEALHYAFLLHDDVIDGDFFRRGRPNLIGDLAETSLGGARLRGVRHWAQAGGILMGNLLLSSAHQLFARAEVPADMRLRLLDLLDHTILETTAGEFTDVGLSDGVLSPDLGTALMMTRRKTASYSFELPLRAAVILAGGSSELESKLSAAGSHLGLAYQLQDDLLSTFGDPECHGKDPYSDLREGKQTAIICFARMTSSWRNMEVDFGDPNLSLEKAEFLRESLRDCGAEDFAVGLVGEQLTAVHKILAGSGAEEIPADVGDVLLKLVGRIEGRRS